MIAPLDALNEVLRAAGLPPASADDVVFEGAEPVLPSSFLLATAGAAAIGATGLAAAGLWALRSGRRQQVSVDLRHAAAALRSGGYLRIDGRAPASPWAGISGFYRTQDERWIQFHCNYAHHRDGVLAILGAEDNREAVQSKALRWGGQELEDALAAAGMCAGLVRSPAEWRAHSHGRVLEALPLFEVVRIGDSRIEGLPEGPRPLSGVRVLDLSRVLAGPVGARTLAEHSADVLRITAEHLPAQPDVDIDTGHGKLSARLDLRDRDGHDRLTSLLGSADVFLQAYRPGSLADRGFSPEEVARIRPGIVYVSLSAYGHEGRWRDRRGFDSLVQSVSGIVHEHSWARWAGEPAEQSLPRHLPAQAIDYVSGYLLAFGAMEGLRRRATEGGSYLVRVSLAQTGRWIQGLGRVESATDPRSGPNLRFEDIEDLLGESESPFGRLRFVLPAARLSETPGRWNRPAAPLSNDAAAWPSVAPA